MIHLFHGSDTASSRQALVNLKKNYPSGAVTELLEEGWSAGHFQTLCRTQPMFTDQSLIVVEKWKDTAALSSLEFLNALPLKHDAVQVAIWTGKKLRANHKLISLIKNLKGEVKVFEQKKSAEIFSFLDCLGNRTPKQAYLKLESLLNAGEDPIGITTMIAYHLRNLLMAATQSPAFLKLHPFVQKKTNQQASNFTEKELIGLYEKVLKADIGLKSGDKEGSKGVLIDLVGEFKNVD